MSNDIITFNARRREAEVDVCAWITFNQQVEPSLTELPSRQRFWKSCVFTSFFLEERCRSRDGEELTKRVGV